MASRESYLIGVPTGGQYRMDDRAWEQLKKGYAQDGGSQGVRRWQDGQVRRT